jgi:hypothetical protein
MPIRFIVEIEQLKNGQMLLNTTSQQRGDVSQHEQNTSAIVAQALRGVTDAIMAVSKKSQFAEGHSAEVLKKVSAKQRKDCNRFPDQETGGTDI